MAGVQLSLRERSVTNNSFVDIDEIGYDNTGALLCVVGNASNSSSAQVNWYSPESIIIGESETVGSGMTLSDDIMSTSQSFAVSRSEGNVSLFRRHSADTQMDLGRFCCMLPDAEHMACANIGIIASFTLYIITVDFPHNYSEHQYD